MAISGTVIVLGIALPLDVPVSDRSDDVSLICRAKLDFDLEAALGLDFL